MEDLKAVVCLSMRILNIIYIIIGLRYMIESESE